MWTTSATTGIIMRCDNENALRNYLDAILVSLCVLVRVTGWSDEMPKIMIRWLV